MLEKYLQKNLNIKKIRFVIMAPLHGILQPTFFHNHICSFELLKGNPVSPPPQFFVFFYYIFPLLEHNNIESPINNSL